MTKSSPIGVFDSGIGGLSVLRQLIRFLPYERYIYLGDTARVPYGNKSEETVRRYGGQCAEFLLSKGVKMIIVACNTVSAVALDSIRAMAGEDIPVIGMIVPAAGAALRTTANGRIGVIGTRATINSNAYCNELLRLSAENHVDVYSKAAPLFVPLVEEGMTRHPAARLIAEEYTAELKEKGIDTLVLGCTHYPLLSPMLREILPEVSLVDSGEQASVTALRLLAESGALEDERNEFIMKPRVEFYVTDLPATFHEQAAIFLGYDAESPKKATLGE